MYLGKLFDLICCIRVFLIVGNMDFDLRCLDNKGFIILCNKCIGGVVLESVSLVIRKRY